MFDTVTSEAITNIAKQYKIPVAGLFAVVAAESSGTAFWTVNGSPKPAIRFEGHYFYARLSGMNLDKAIKAGLAHKDAGAVKNPRSYAARYQLLANAAAIDKQAAYESTSWGLGQVMGANWKDLGYDSVFDLVNDSYTVVGQIETMVRFIVKNGLVKFIVDQDWNSFARRYNGPGYKKNKYDTKLAAEYAKYSTGTVKQAAVDDVVQIQKMLNRVGTYGLLEDGVMGVNTKTAIRDFQLKNALVVDGLYGPITREELEKDYLEIANKKEDILGKIIAIGSGSGAAISEAAKQIEPLAATSQWLQYVFLGLTVVGVLVTLKATIWK